MRGSHRPCLYGGWYDDVKLWWRCAMSTSERRHGGSASCDLPVLFLGRSLDHESAFAFGFAFALTKGSKTDQLGRPVRYPHAYGFTKTLGDPWGSLGDHLGTFQDVLGRLGHALAIPGVLCRDAIDVGLLHVVL